MYNIKILQECTEEEYIAIVTVINELLENVNIDTNLIVKRYKRTKENTPEWALIGKQERLRNKF